METVKEILEKSQLPKYSLQEVAASYSHIELTEDEMLEAVIQAKQKKERELELNHLREVEAKNRRMLSSGMWGFKVTESYMQFRADEIFDKKFRFDEYNSKIFNLLCYYFSDDPEFEKTCNLSGIKNASRSKGILLTGNFGTGKTWMMKLFTKNQRQVFFLRNAKQLAETFETDGQDIFATYYEKFINSTNDKDVFYQTYAGLCIDDIGTEDVKNNYGNKKNVVGDLIEQRYSKRNTGIFLHATTNLSAQQLKDFYGERVTSRMREVFNFIEFPGNDRRK